MDSVTELLWLLGVLGLVGGVALAHKIFGARRRRLLVEAGSSIGFFPASNDQVELPAEIHLFSKGNGNSGYRNALVGSAAGFEAQIFDYCYEEGSGRSRHEVQQTVAAFHLQGANMPDFQVLPRTMFRKLQAAFGGDGLRFESNPEFSQKYVVRGADAVSASAMFTSGILSFLEARRCLFNIEGYFDWMIIYTPSKTVSPAKLREFVDKAGEIASGMLSQVPRPLAH